MTTPNDQMFIPASWQHQVLLELTSMATSIIHGHYESPQDVAGDMQTRAAAIANTLGIEAPSQLPSILDTVGAHVFALQCAAYEHGKFSNETEANLIGRWQMSGYHAYQSAAPETVATVTSHAIEAIEAHKVRNWAPKETENTPDESA